MNQDKSIFSELSRPGFPGLAAFSASKLRAISSFFLSLTVLFGLTACEPKIQLKGSEGIERTTASTVTDQGVLDVTQTWKGSGNYTDYDPTKLLASSVCGSAQIFGVSGTAACLAGSLSTPASSSEVLAGKEYFDAIGNVQTGTMATRSLSSTTTAVASGYYAATDLATVDTDLTATNIRSGTNLFGVSGTLTPAASACTDNALNAGACTTAASRYVSGTLGTNVTGAGTNASATTTVTLAIPGNRFYDGATSCQLTDSNLLAGNIISGKTIFGVSGNVAACIGSNQSGCITSATFLSQATPTTPPAVTNVLSGKQFYAGGAMQTGTMTNQGTWDARVAFPGAGYFAGISNTLSAAQVCTSATGGIDFLGATGTAVCQSGTPSDAAAVSDVLSGKEYWDSSGTLQVGTLATTSPAQSAVDVGSENDDSVTTVTVTPTSPDLFAGFTVNVGAHFQQANICAGKTIFGRLGIAVCKGLSARTYRNIGSSTERAIPVVDTDHDGYNGVNPIARADTSSLSDCGFNQTTVDARIANCAFSWDGMAQGNSGQGKWILVTKANGYEVWRDERTGLLWSGNLPANNWCQASGNIENAGGVDCSPGNGLQPNPSGESMCAENGSLKSSGFDDQKGGMRLASTGSSPSVAWRLLTRDDYLQAYSNGIGYVLPNFLDTAFWTASVGSGYHDNAWVFVAVSDGYQKLVEVSRGNSFSVRCVGR